jgi:hypothetical protein
MSRVIRCFLSVAAVLCSAAAAHAQPRPVVVELYTSEGCSSCPPAEAYLGTLRGRSDVIALAFHVGYWDDPEWRDRFALPECTQRQEGYARALQRSSVYTPQLVIDGRYESVGADDRRVAQALSERRDGVPIALNVQEGELRVQLAGHAGAPRSDVVLVAYQRQAVSAIGGGENAGRSLAEFNIVRRIQTLGRWSGDARSFHLPLAALPPDATDVAVLLQPSGQAPIIGAAARALRQ